MRQGGRVLVIREEDEPFPKSWVLPGGYPQPGETLPQAAVREVHEELGLDIEVDRLVGLYEDFEAGHSGAALHWVIVCYLSYPVTGRTARPSREAIDFAWIDPTLAELGSPPVVRRILSDVAAIRNEDER